MLPSLVNKIIGNNDSPNQKTFADVRALMRRQFEKLRPFYENGEEFLSEIPIKRKYSMYYMLGHNLVGVPWECQYPLYIFCFTQKCLNSSKLKLLFTSLASLVFLTRIAPINICCIFLNKTTQYFTNYLVIFIRCKTFSSKTVG